MAGERNHWLKAALHEGLERLDVDYLLEETARHVTTKGEWMTGVISPSLVATDCRLQRLKKFLGHSPQPGFKHMATRRGKADGVSNYNMLRGFLMEGVLVACLAEVLKDRLIGCAPMMVFDWTHPGDDVVPAGTRFAGHPDVMVVNDDNELELVQIKTPSTFKLDRVEKLGDEDALKSYLPQLATEMYIGRKAGMPIVRNNLLMSTWEATAKISKPRVIVIPVDWHPSLASIPEEVAREVVGDSVRAKLKGEYPAALPAQAWDTWPCSYCSFPRLGDITDSIGCEENQEWDRYAKTGETRLSAPPQEVPVAEIPDNVLPMRRRRRAG